MSVRTLSTPSPVRLLPVSIPCTRRRNHLPAYPASLFLHDAPLFYCLQVMGGISSARRTMRSCKALIRRCAISIDLVNLLSCPHILLCIPVYHLQLLRSALPSPTLRFACTRGCPSPFAAELRQLMSLR